MKTLASRSYPECCGVKCTFSPPSNTKVGNLVNFDTLLLYEHVKRYVSYIPSLLRDTDCIVIFSGTVDYVLAQWARRLCTRLPKSTCSKQTSHVAFIFIQICIFGFGFLTPLYGKPVPENGKPKKRVTCVYSAAPSHGEECGQ